MRHRPAMRQLLEQFFDEKVLHLLGNWGSVAFCNSC